MKSIDLWFLNFNVLVLFGEFVEIDFYVLFCRVFDLVGMSWG